MPTIYKEILIDASPEQVWDAVSGAKLVWITDFLPEHFTTEIQAGVNRGAEVMKATIEAETKGGD